MKEVLVGPAGERVLPAEGNEMIKDFLNLHPGHAAGYVVGSGIVRRILEQPGCEGVRFFNAVAASGAETLVYVGVDGNGDMLQQGIVCDRLKPPKDEISWLDLDWWIGLIS